MSTEAPTARPAPARPRPTTAIGRVVLGAPVRRPRAATCRIVHDVEELRALRPQWDALAAGGGLPTAQHAWAVACADSFLPAGGLHAVTIWRGERLVAAAALGPGRGPGELEPLGMEELFEPADVLASDDEALDALAVALRRLGQVVRIPRLDAASPTLGALAQAYAGRGLLVCREVAGCPTLPLSDAWLAPEGALKSGRRSDLRRARRRAQELGEVTHELHAPGPEEAGPLLEEALAVEASGWKAREGSALLADPRRLAFIRRWAREAAVAGALRLALLRIDGRAVAMQLGAEHDRRLWLLKIGYDEAVARCSPGSLLLLESVRDAAARGLVACEFLGAIADWTAAWTQEERRLVAVRAYSAAPRGLVRLGADVGRGARRRLAAAQR